MKQKIIELSIQLSFCAFNKIQKLRKVTFNEQSDKSSSSSLSCLIFSQSWIHSTLIAACLVVNEIHLLESHMGFEKFQSSFLQSWILLLFIFLHQIEKHFQRKFQQFDDEWFSEIYLAETQRTYAPLTSIPTIKMTLS